MFDNTEHSTQDTDYIIHRTTTLHITKSVHTHWRQSTEVQNTEWRVQDSEYRIQHTC